MQHIQVLLIGPQHVGKSSVASVLANMLGVPCYDTDDILLDIAKTSLAEGNIAQGNVLYNAKTSSEANIITNATANSTASSVQNKAQNYPQLPAQTQESAQNNTLTVREVFALVGQEQFRLLEAEAIAHLLASTASGIDLAEASIITGNINGSSRIGKGIVDFVSATGGGLVSNKEAWQMAAPLTPKILLDARVDTVWKRVIAQGIPAYLNSSINLSGTANTRIEKCSADELKEYKQKFVELFNARLQVYRAQADIVVDTTDRSLQEIASAIVNSPIFDG